MNIVYRFFTVLVLLIAGWSSQAIASSINLFLKPAPPVVQHLVRQALVDEGLINEKLERLHTKSASKIGRKMLKNGFKRLLPTPAGFIALYGGYVDYSDPDGNITFPLLHKKKMLYLVITPAITLTPIHGHTFSHKNVISGAPIARYLFERKKSKKKTIFWRVTEERMPTHNRLNPLSIVLLTKPKNIVVPTGDAITSKHINLILPSLYVVGNMDNERILLNFLDIRKYFEQITREHKRVTDKVEQRLIMNN